jgi:hypothetical protein
MARLWPTAAPQTGQLLPPFKAEYSHATPFFSQTRTPLDVGCRPAASFRVRNRRRSGLTTGNAGINCYGFFGTICTTKALIEEAVISGSKEERKSRNAIQGLESLRRLFPKCFIFHRLGNTHEKILLMDSSIAVVGSFNWLSFEGRDSGKIRCESSVLISDPAKVRELFGEFLGRFPRKGKRFTIL